MVFIKYFMCTVSILICVCKVSAKSETVENNTINIAVTGVNGISRNAYLLVEQAFIKENPGVSVNLMLYEAEHFKKNIVSILSKKNTVDVVAWQAGERLLKHARSGLILPITDLWQKNNYAKEFSASIVDGVSIDNQIYAIPIAYSVWGMFYNKVLFKQLNAIPPQTWQQFTHLLAKFKGHGVAPIAIGAKQPWFIANWFEYLNIRLNGLAFHQQFIQGKVSNQSPQIVGVLTYLQELAASGYFIEGYKQYSFRDLLPLIYRKRAGVMLADSGIGIRIPKEIQDSIGFFTFPFIKQDDHDMKKNVQSAPANIVFIAKNAKNPALAKRFLTFFARADIQSLFSSTMVQLPANNLAVHGDNKFIHIAKESVVKASGLTLFFDREIEKQYGSELMDIWQNFLTTVDVTATANKMEQSRLRYLRRIE